VDADARAKALMAAGVRVINLAAGEPDQRGPVEAEDAAVASIRAGEARYGPPGGLTELRVQVASMRGRSVDEVMITAGAKAALHAVLQAIVEPGDEVLLPTPCWVSFPSLIELAGGIPVRVPTSAEQGFVLSPGAVEAAITSRTRVLLLNSPANPTGAVIPAPILKDLGALAVRHDLVIVSDEIYAGIVYEGPAPSPIDLAEIRDRTVVVDGVSKSYAMTGWRVGWAIGPSDLVSAMIRYQGQTVSGPSPPNQRAALAALRADGGHRDSLVRSFRRRRDRAREALAAIPGLTCGAPAGAIYLFPGVAAYFGRRTPAGEVIDGSVALQAWLLEEAHVAVVAGAPFGADGHMRLSLAADEEELMEAIRRVAEALGRLR
jgi:aspartate aminotransferase